MVLVIGTPFFIRVKETHQQRLMENSASKYKEKPSFVGTSSYLFTVSILNLLSKNFTRYAEMFYSTHY